MVINDFNRLEKNLEKLTGRKAPIDPKKVHKVFVKWPLGHSQFNEVLLLLGFDRVSEKFFHFLINMSYDGPNKEINSMDHLIRYIDYFRQIALYEFGNVQFAFKQLSANDKLIKDTCEAHIPISSADFEKRNDPFTELIEIPPDKTYYLGYIIQGEIEEKLQKDPNNIDAQKERDIMVKWMENGYKNHETYLSSDHLDVYVATSMRLRHEFVFISKLTKLIFSDKSLQDLRIRWFDPTQAYTEDRIDKGLSEALMLKRARCTLYLSQESDTLGKDSELASTLAQGKPVIAYVPIGDESYVEELIKDLVNQNPKISRREILLEQLQIFDPDLAWREKQVKKWLNEDSGFENEILDRLKRSVKTKYDKRAKTLIKDHPLAIQVHLDTGVANGVLVVRKVSDCVALLKSILTNDMQFVLEEKKPKRKYLHLVEEESDKKYLYLKEKISNSIFRFMTGDKMLTNSFWNFYLDQS